MSLRSEGKGLLVVALNEYASRRDNRNVPYTAEQIAADALECADAGAAVVHLHSRNVDGSPLIPGGAVYRRVIELVAQESDALVWPTAPPLGGDVTSAGELSHIWELVDDPPHRGVLELAPFDLFRKGAPPYWDERGARLLQSPAELALGGAGGYEPPGALTEIVRRGLTPVFCCFDLTDVRWTSHVVRAGYVPEPAFVLIEFLGHYLMSGSPTVANLDGTLGEWRDDVDVEFVVAAQMMEDRDEYERLLLHGLDRGMGLRVGIGDAPDLYPDVRNVDLVRWGVDRLGEVGLEPARPADVAARFAFATPKV